jgi:hypothetical protein
MTWCDLLKVQRSIDARQHDIKIATLHASAIHIISAVEMSRVDAASGMMEWSVNVIDARLPIALTISVLCR